MLDYAEKEYILDDTKAQEYWFSIRKALLEECEKFKCLHYAATKAYEIIIKKAALLMKELNMTTAFTASIFFEHLLWSGFFSANHTYAYKVKGTKSIGYYFGLDICNGQGTCLTNSEFLSRLLNELNLTAYMAPTHLYRHIKRDYETNLKVKKAFEWPSIENVSDKIVSLIEPYIPNHMCVFVEKECQYYIFDPTNLCVFHYDNLLQGTIIDGTGSIELCPQGLGYFEELSDEQRTKLIYGFINVNSSKDHDFLNSALTYTSKIMEERASLLEDFYDDIHPETIVVAKTLKRYKEK